MAQMPAVTVAHIPSEMTAASECGLSAQSSTVTAAVTNLLGHIGSCRG